MWFTVTRDGKPLRKRRYAYSESFAAIAHAAMAKAEPEKAAYHLKRAREIFDLYCRWNFTPGLMPAKFTDVRPMVVFSRYQQLLMHSRLEWGHA